MPTDAFAGVREMESQHDRLRNLQKSEELFRRLTDFSAEWLYWRTPGGEMRYVSPAGEEISGYSVEELMKFPETCEAIIHSDDLHLWREHAHEADKGGKPIPIEFRIVTKQGDIRWISHICRPIYDENGAFLGISGSNRDITEHKTAEEQLRFLGTHDMLTGLFNRAFFDAELDRLAKGRQCPIGIVMADVDGLKKVNDHHGHGAGDRLLQRAAQLLKNTFRAEDFVARIGGDEFAILLPHADFHIVGELLKRVKSSQESINCSGGECPVSLSLGAATVRKGKRLLRALKLADKRMYQHKFSKKQRKP